MEKRVVTVSWFSCCKRVQEWNISSKEGFPPPGESQLKLRGVICALQKWEKMEKRACLQLDEVLSSVKRCPIVLSAVPSVATSACIVLKTCSMFRVDDMLGLISWSIRDIIKIRSTASWTSRTLSLATSFSI